MFMIVFTAASVASATYNVGCEVTPTGVSVGKDDFPTYLFVIGNVTVNGVTSAIWWRLGLVTDTKAQQRYSTAMMALATGLKLTIAYNQPGTTCQTGWWNNDDTINYVIAKP
jgi:hypothetical protein